MKKKWIKILNSVLALGLCLSATGCGELASTYGDFSSDVSAESSLEPVGSVLNTVSYEGEEAITEAVEKTYSSEDGLCVIEKKPSYYEVYLDYTGGDYRAVGVAYAKTVKQLDLAYDEILEPYLYENIKMAFPSLDNDYSSVVDRINVLLVNIPDDYREEMEGFAETISGGVRGMENNGILSYEEALLINLVPDCLRGTNCNALSVWGEKTVSGERITSRTLEWTLGSENQMCMAHAVTHFKMKDETNKNNYVTFSVIGMLDVLTGINDKGVLVGILDAGSGIDYVCEGKKCYTYELRYALEHMPDARSIGEYMVSESKNFTYSHNIIITDENDAFVAEDCVYRMEDLDEDDLEVKTFTYTAKSTLRDKDTPLMDGITWDNPDSLCVVNTFLSEGSDDNFTGSGSNFVRFSKFNTWVGDKEKLAMSDVKDIVTRETQDIEQGYHGLHSDSVFQTIIYDYGTHELDVCFTGVEGVVNHPVFVKVEE